MMSVREGDAVRQMPVKEIIIRNTFAAAAKGEGRALKVALGMLEIADNEADEQTGVLQKASLQLQAYWKSWCVQIRRRYPGLTDYPKPAHVTIDPSTGFAVWNSPWLRKKPARNERVGEYPSDWLSALAQTCSSMNEMQKIYGRAISLGKCTVALSVLEEALEERGPLAEAQRFCDRPDQRRLTEMTREELREAVRQMLERKGLRLAGSEKEGPE